MELHIHLSFSLFFLLFFLHQSWANNTGYTCSSHLTSYPCHTYAFYTAKPPSPLSLSSIADLFNVSPLMISRPSNLSSSRTPLIPNQNLLIPITCSCLSNHSYANISYQIKSGDTFYLVSTSIYQNLTTFEAVELLNPSVIPTNLQIGEDIAFPIFCQCPNKTQFGNPINFFITYVFQPSDTVDSVARKFGSDVQLLVSSNGGRREIAHFSTILVPTSEIPQLEQPIVSESSSLSGDGSGTVVGLAVALGVLGFMVMVMLSGILWFWWVFKWKRGRRRKVKERAVSCLPDKSFMADVSECLDKYKVFGIEELREATNGFDKGCAIEGSVYKGCLRGEVYAVKKMKWNAYEELKILQKVNHHNLVRLEGFCIDSHEGDCYLVYEYIHNGSLYSWLHGVDKAKKLDWKARLQIAVDIANGLQYIHEHTRPSVVHKDIKTSNILLGANMRAKIANFGLAKSGWNAVTMNIVGTQGYLAPEYLLDGLVTTKMDVFAFGVVLLELVSGREAISEEREMLWMEAERVFEGEDYREERLRAWMDWTLAKECCSMESVVNVLAVARACLHRDSSKRPSMVEIVYMLCKADELYFDFSEDGLVPSGIMAR